MGSDFRVEVVAIESIERHPNADRLDCVAVRGWRVVTSRTEDGQPRYKVGDKTIYIPIDAVLPKQLEDFLFPIGSKVTLSKSRVKSIKLRGAISQGMIVDFSPELLEMYPALSKAKLGDDVTELLQITKYEAPVSSLPQHMQVGGSGQRNPGNNPAFQKYNDISNWKNYPQIFTDEDTVYISEKLHGTSYRAGLFPSVASTLWDKIRKFFGLLPAYQFCYGSRNVQLQRKPKRGELYYGFDIYGKISKQYDIPSKLKPNEAIYGEIVGDGVQAKYNYGHGPGEHSLFVYDVKVDDKYLPYEQFKAFCEERELPMVPFLYLGTYSPALISAMREGDSTVGGQKIREGVVLKDAYEKQSWNGRKVLKAISDSYLTQKGADELTDWH
jgi:RNA ligase (TIGR02306 family)